MTEKNCKETTSKSPINFHLKTQFLIAIFHFVSFRKSQLLALLLCVGSVDVAIGNVEAEQRLLDVLQDFYAEGILTLDGELI